MKKLQTIHDFICNLHSINKNNIKTFADDITTIGVATAVDEGFTATYKIISYISSIPVGHSLITDITLFLQELDYQLKPKFEVEVLDRTTTDLILTVEVSEDVLLVADNSGRYLSNGNKYNAVWQGFDDTADLNNFVIFDHHTQ
jgi:hypothetical protein